MLIKKPSKKKGNLKSGKETKAKEEKGTSRCTLSLAVSLAPALSPRSPVGNQARQQISKVLTSLADQRFQFAPQQQCQAAVNDSNILHFVMVPGLVIGFCFKSSMDSLLRGSSLLRQ